MPLPCDHDLLECVGRDRRSMLKYCKKAKKRRAWPARGPPVEATPLLLDPTTQLSDPSEQIWRWEGTAANAAGDDEEETARLPTAFRFQRGRKLLEKLGWTGGGLGVREGIAADPEALHDNYGAGREETAGLGRAKPSGYNNRTAQRRLTDALTK
eukprot:7803510-Pyramimonas_sp.AAC.1